MKIQTYSRNFVKNTVSKAIRKFSLVKSRLKTFNFPAFFQKKTFIQIFVIWIQVILVFGLIYYFLSFIPGNSISYHGTLITHDFSGLLNSFYFSFVTSTSLGYGDISPIGAAKALSIIEVISGLIIYGMIISKIVSVKQETLLEEIHTMSSKEQLNRLRSSFYLYRSDIGKQNYRINNKTATKSEINDLWMTFTSFDVALMDTVRMMKKAKKKDDFDFELILNSIELSLARTFDLVTIMDQKRVMWRKGVNVSTLGSILNNTNSIAGQLEKVSDKKVQSQLEDIKKIQESLKEQISKQVEAKEFDNRNLKIWMK